VFDEINCMNSDRFERSCVKYNTILRTAAGDVSFGDRIQILSLSYANLTDNQRRKFSYFLANSTLLVMKVFGRIFLELGLPRTSSANSQHLHTVSATCSNTVTFITFPAIKRIHFFRVVYFTTLSASDTVQPRI